MNTTNRKEPESRTNAPVEVRGEKRVRTVPHYAIQHAINIKFHRFPLAATNASGAPATWRKVDGDVVIVCPRCGQQEAVFLDDVNGYRVDSRGIMFPSYLCPKPYCDYDHYVQLYGWSGMGALGRKKDNERGVIFYCMQWAKGDRILPPRYTHAVDWTSARLAFAPIVAAEGAEVIAIAPAVDPHVAGGDFAGNITADGKNGIVIH